MSHTIIADHTTRIRVQKRGNTYEFRLIPVGEINIDHANYQRKLLKGKMGRIRDELDWDVFGVLLVSERADGSIWVIDGQHRAIGVLEKMGAGELVPCWVKIGGTIRKEALIFNGANTLRGVMHKNQSFRARTVGEDARAISLIQLLEEVGIDHTFGSTKLAKTIMCWGALEFLQDRKGLPFLKKVLRFSLDCWDGQRPSMEAQYIKGVADFIVRHNHNPGWKEEVIASSLKMAGIEEVATRARKYRQMDHAPDVSVSLAMRDTYNAGLKRGCSRLKSNGFGGDGD